MNWYKKHLITAATNDLRYMIDQVGKLYATITNTIYQSRQDPTFQKYWKNNKVVTIMKSLIDASKSAVRFLQTRKIPSAANAIEQAFQYLKSLCGSKCTNNPILRQITQAFNRAYKIVNDIANRFIEQPQQKTVKPKARPMPKLVPQQKPSSGLLDMNPEAVAL